MVNSLLSSVSAFLFGSTVQTVITKTDFIPYQTSEERNTLIGDLMVKGFKFPIETYDDLKVAPEMERREYDIIVQDDFPYAFIANGVRYRIPKKILDCSDLHVNGVLNQGSFPNSISAAGQHGFDTYIVHGGKVVSTSDEIIDEDAQLTACQAIRRYREDQMSSQDVDVLRGFESSGLEINCSISSDSIYLYIVYPEQNIEQGFGANIHLYRAYDDQLDHSEEMIKTAFEFARAFMIVNCSLGQPSGRFDEYRIAQTIFALFLADKE